MGVGAWGAVYTKVSAMVKLSSAQALALVMARYFEREEAGYRPPHAGYRERGGQGRIACGEGGHQPAARELLRFSGRLPAAATSTDVTRMCDSDMTRMTPDTGGHPSSKAARPGAPSVRRRETFVSYIS